MIKLHVLKIKREYFNDILRGRKTFELRRNDRDFKVGEYVRFININGYQFIETNKYLFQITYVLKDVPEYGLNSDYCIFGIRCVSVQHINSYNLMR